MLRLLRGLLRQAGRALGAYGAELLELLQAACADASHDVNMQGCAALGDLAGGWAGRAGPPGASVDL
jgi:hypothetical protein